MELEKKIVCFLDGYGIHISGLVTFEMKSLKTNHFLNPKEIWKWYLVVQIK